MSLLQFGLLVLAGAGAGLIGSVAGLASLISYPALLATGVPPVTANVTNTVALVLSGVGAVSASRPELTGQRRRLVPLCAAGLCGGVVGAVLLLATPPGAFERIVPFLIAAASAAILVQRPPRELAAEGAAHAGGRPRRLPWALIAGTFAISVYGGYFGAAAGVLMLAMFLLVTGEGVPISNALKNVVLVVANGVAALGYVLFADVDWPSALPLAIGFLVGGRLGPSVVRRVPQTPLRRLIAIAGLGLAMHLGIDAFS
jgi:uncharacterized membrane protein YfcA